MLPDRRGQGVWTEHFHYGEYAIEVPALGLEALAVFYP